MKFLKNEKEVFESFNFKLMLLIFVLSGIQVIYASVALHSEWLEYRLVQKNKQANQIINYSAEGLKNFMIERGNISDILSRKASASSEDIAYVIKRRNAADKYFKLAMANMQEEYPVEKNMIDNEYKKICVLRTAADKEMLKPKIKRDISVTNSWFSNCTKYINIVISTSEKILRKQLYNSRIYSCNKLIIKDIQFRNIVGNEETLITSTLAKRRIIGIKDYHNLLILRGQSNQIWQDIESEVAIENVNSIKKAKDIVRYKYYKVFRPYQDDFLNMILTEKAYKGADKELNIHALTALDSIFTITNAAHQVIINENNIKEQNANRSFLLSVIQLLLNIFIILFIPIHINKTVNHPLNNLVDTMDALRLGNIKIRVKYTDRKDEVGKLARGVKLLKETMIEEKSLKEDLVIAVDKLKEASITDPLTGLHNRRYIDERADEILANYRRNNSVFSIIMSDIDKFKKFNDNYGHDCGDYALIFAAKLLREICRGQDILIRLGGEEFLIILPETDIDGAYALAERLRKCFETKGFHYEGLNLKISMTFGISEYFEELGMDGSIKNADNALIDGKNSGRNKVVVYTLEDWKKKYK